MGRSSYTASTVSHLALLAGTSSSSSGASGSHAGESSHNKHPETLPVGADDSDSIIVTRPRRVKDAPTLWAHQAFDPDDEALPTVEERFLEPYEEFPSLTHPDDAIETDEEEEDEDEDDDDGDRDWDDETHEFELDEHEVHIALHSGEESSSISRSNAAIAELAQVLMGTQATSNAAPRFERQNEIWEPDSEHAQGQDSENLPEGEHTESEYDEPPHGNGGYYDFGYSREDEQVIDRRSTPSIVDDFSPSAGVFHRHTLPFNLPNMGEMQLQRRASNTITSTLAADNSSTFAY